MLVVLKTYHTVQMWRRHEVGRKYHIFYLHARYGEIVPGSGHQWHSGLSVGKLHKFTTIHPGGVAVVIVMVEKCAPCVYPHGYQCCPRGGSAVFAAHHSPRFGIFMSIETCRNIHFHAVCITIVIRFVRYSMYHHHCSCRVDHDAYMRVASAAVGNENGVARKSESPP